MELLEIVRLVRKQLTEAGKWPIMYLSLKPSDVGVALIV